MKLSHDIFVAKWDTRFPDNDTFTITAGDLREFQHDVADSFGEALANVPRYVVGAGTSYEVGYLVRYTVAGQPEAFFYALQAGPLPAPTGQAGDPNWRLVPGPVQETALSQSVGLVEAQGLRATGGVKAGRLYLVAWGLNAQLQPQQVFVVGLGAVGFDVEGTLVVNGQASRVTVDVAAGTLQPVAGGGGGTQYLNVRTVQETRVAFLTLPQTLTVLLAQLVDNAQAVNLQVNQKVGGNWQAGVQEPVGAINTRLASLSTSDYLNGVELEIETVAITINKPLAVLLPVAGSWLSGGLAPLSGTRGTRRVDNPDSSPEPTAGLAFNNGVKGQRFYFENPALTEGCLTFWIKLKPGGTTPGTNDFWLWSGRPGNNVYSVVSYGSGATYYVEGQSFAGPPYGLPAGYWKRVALNIDAVNVGQFTLLSPDPTTSTTDGLANVELYDVRLYSRKFTLTELADRTFAPNDSTLIRRYELGPLTDPTQPVLDLSGHNSNGTLTGF